MAVAGLILSIVGLISGIIGFGVPILAVLGLPIAIVGLVLSVIGKKKQDDIASGVGTAGMVVGIIAVVFTAITFFTCGICVLAVSLS